MEPPGVWVGEYGKERSIGLKWGGRFGIESAFMAYDLHWHIHVWRCWELLFSPWVMDHDVPGTSRSSFIYSTISRLLNQPNQADYHHESPWRVVQISSPGTRLPKQTGLSSAKLLISRTIWSKWLSDVTYHGRYMQLHAFPVSIRSSQPNNEARNLDQSSTQLCGRVGNNNSMNLFALWPWLSCDLANHPKVYAVHGLIYIVALPVTHPKAFCNMYENARLVPRRNDLFPG
jgi:hypothetical protein